MNQIQTLLLSFLMNVLSHFPNYIFPSEVLPFAINFLLKVAFSKLGISQARQCSIKNIFPYNIVVAILNVAKINIFLSNVMVSFYVLYIFCTITSVY